MRLFKLLLLTLLTCFGLFIVSSCETWRSQCGGEIIVENPIPDTTLYVDAEPFFRDLFAPPVVLNQTNNKIVVTTLLVDDLSIVNASIERSATTGRLNAIKIEPLKEGKTTVQILADDGCEQIETSFKVTVLDTA